MRSRFVFTTRSGKKELGKLFVTLKVWRDAARIKSVRKEEKNEAKNYMKNEMIKVTPKWEEKSETRNPFCECCVDLD